MKKIALFVFTLCSAISTIAASGRIEYVDASAAGLGNNESYALRDALTQCISQVNGMLLDSKQMLEAITVSDGDKSYASEKFQEQVATITRGVVASYKVVSVSKTADGRYRMEVSAKIAKYKKGIGADRLRIVVVPFGTTQESYMLGGKMYSSADVTRQLNQTMVNRLVATRKFTVLDRENSQAILKEKAVLLNETCPVEEMCKLGQVLSADYIVVGMVESLTIKSRQVKMQMSGLTATINDVGAAVTLRFIDIATKQVKFSDVINAKFDLKGGGDSNVLDVFNQVSELSIKKIMDSIYPLRVVALEDDEVVVNQGGDSIIEGDKYDLFVLGKTIVDPYTKEVLGKKETRCGRIEIIRVKAKTSDARVIEGLPELKLAIANNQQVIARLVKEKKDTSPKKLSERKDVIW